MIEGIFHNDGNKKGEGTYIKMSMIYTLFQIRGFKVLICQFKSYTYNKQTKKKSYTYKINLI